MQENTPKPYTTGAMRIPGDPLTETTQRLAEFLLLLIQAFLRTGYYTPNHPQSKNAKAGLYKDFQNLLDQRNELSFLVRDDSKEKSILIEGILPEAVDLNTVMLQGMAELYTPKFVTFLERKDLISLTLKNTMAWEEFNDFVDIMSEPKFVETQEQSDKEQFVQVLREKKILHVSFIFKEELLAKDRDIPWRAQIALSRLKKDFKMIPFFQDLDEEGLKKVRKQIIQDVVRPMQNAEVIYPILMNSDLAQTEEFRESEIDEEIIASLSDNLLLQTSQALLADVAREKGSASHSEKSPIIAKQMASHLNESGIKTKASVIEQFYVHKLIPFEHLPKATQQRIRLQQYTNQFIEQTEHYLQQFGKIRDPKKYLKVAQSFTRIIPELIRRDRFEEIRKIISEMDRHFSKESPISSCAGQVLEQIGKGKIAEVLKTRFMKGQKETCQDISPLFLSLGKRSVPHLFSMFKESSDQLVQKSAFELLLRIDSSAVEAILDELSQEPMGVETAIHRVRVLGELNSTEWLQPVANALRASVNHENPRVREEALWSYYKLMDDEGEELYLAHINDTDIGVQKRAIQCLGRIRSEMALERFLQLLQEAEDAPSDKNKQIEASLLSALSFFGNFGFTDGESLEDFLLTKLDHQLNLGPLKFLKKTKSPLSEAAVGAICETLGEIGTEKSCPILQKLEKQQESLWGKKAEEALLKIAERAHQDTAEEIEPA